MRFDWGLLGNVTFRVLPEQCRSGAMSAGGHAAEAPDELVLILTNGQVDVSGYVFHVGRHDCVDVRLDLGDRRDGHVSSVEERDDHHREVRLRGDVLFEVAADWELRESVANVDHAFEEDGNVFAVGVNEDALAEADVGDERDDRVEGGTDFPHEELLVELGCVVLSLSHDFVKEGLIVGALSDVVFPCV